MISGKLSSLNSARVCQKIKQKGFAIPTPKQSSIYRVTYILEHLSSYFSKKKNTNTLLICGSRVRISEIVLVFSSYRVTYKQANELKEKMKTELKEDAYALHLMEKRKEIEKTQLVF